MIRLAESTLLVRDYDEALAFYVALLGFTLVSAERLDPLARRAYRG